MKWEQYKTNAVEAVLQGNYPIAERFWGLALKSADDSEAPLAISICLDGLGDLCLMQDKFAEAEGYYRDSLNKKTETLGEEHPEIAMGLNNLAGALCAEGKFSEAELMLKKALAILFRVFGATHPETRWTIKSLMSVYRELKKPFDLSEAAAWIQPSMEGGKEKDAAKQPVVCATCHRWHIAPQCPFCTQIRLKALALSTGEWKPLAETQ